MFKDAEKRINRKGSISYWKDNVIIGKRCTKCGKDKEISNFTLTNKKKLIYRAECKECQKQWETEYHRIYRENNKDKLREYNREYCKNNHDKVIEKRRKYKENNVEKIRDYNKQWRECNKEKVRQHNKTWRENNKEKEQQRKKHWRENNKEKIKAYNDSRKEYMKERYQSKIAEYKELYKENREYMLKRDKQRYEKNKESNLQYISNIIEEINPILAKLNIKTYGFIYKFENIKTNRVYIGQTTNPLKERYRSNIIKGWIEERINRDAQKFKEELIEEDIRLTEIVDVAFCKYHLDKLEVYYIDKYNSYNNGYNSQAGNYITDDGIEEFNKLLQKYNLQFIDGKLIECA